MHDPYVILGSRSPCRLELLQLLVPRERILVRPPRNSAEAGFEGLTDFQAIAGRLLEIVDTKRQDVEAQCSDEERASSLRLVADTIIVARHDTGLPIVLGQPPESDWQSTVREWLARYYSGQTHVAMTGLCLWDSTRIVASEIVTTEVTFQTITSAQIEWYLSTGEPLGKAGGYALQGLASLMVSRIEGSLTNVVGLPLEVVQRALERAA